MEVSSWMELESMAKASSVARATNEIGSPQSVVIDMITGKF